MLIRRETERDADLIRAITTAAFAPRRSEWQPHFQVRVLSGYQPRLRGMFTYPEPFDRT